MAIIHGKTSRGEPYIRLTGKDSDEVGFDRLFNALTEELRQERELSAQSIGHNFVQFPNEEVANQTVTIHQDDYLRTPKV